MTSTTSTTTSSAPYPGPAYERHDEVSGAAWWVPLGPAEDDGQVGHFVAVDRAGAHGGLVTGGTGSGKTTCLDLIALGLASSGRWQVWTAQGRSDDRASAALAGVSAWSVAGPGQAYAQLCALEAAVEARAALAVTLTDSPDSGERDGGLVECTDPGAQPPARRIDPCPAYPGLMWVIDDDLATLLVKGWRHHPQVVARFAQLVRRGPRFGVTVLAATGSLLVQDFAGDLRLRGDLAGSNLFAFFCGNRFEILCVGGEVVAPYRLPPRGGGWAYTSHDDGPTVRMRTAWPGRSSSLPELPDVVLDPATERAVDQACQVRDGQRSGR